MGLRIAGGEFKGRVLKTPPSVITRPTQERVRQALFNKLQFEIEGTTFADLFAGSGAVGLEALSRGAERCFFVEKNIKAFNALKANVEALNVSERAQIIKSDIKHGVQRLPLCDIVFLDPPYSNEEEDILLLNALPFETFVKKGGRIFFETAHPLSDEMLETLLIVSTRTFGDTELIEFTLR